jgi:hypothetical protein
MHDGDTMQTRIVPGVLPGEGYVRERQIIGGRRKRTETIDGERVVVEYVEQGVLPMSRSTWKRGQKAGRYPRGIKHGSATLYDVDWIRALLAEIRETSP